MGRSTRQQQRQPPTQTVTKLPKVYSKQKLLRNKSVKQELLLSSTTRRSPKLNAVMQMDPPGNRRRLGRNPIAEQQQQQQDSSSSPTDADSSNETVPGGSSGNSAECRRSSRKKTIKFDVRDLLNKNRKSHKIQIEARIDSNAPKIGAGQASKAELDSKQKNFIEKSAIFRRYSISENKLPPRPPPPPGALIHTIQQCVGELEQLPLEGGEINLAAISPIARRLSRTQDILTASMMKPKQVSSLIVTKLESASTSKAAVAARSRVVGVFEPSTSAATQQQKPPTKRGRKPKAKIFAESTTESSSSLSSNDGFDLSSAIKRTSVEKGKFKDELVAIGRKVTLIDENSTTGIDLKENLDASAVTLPLPKILTDSMHNSTDDSFVAAEEDLFTLRNHSSDESTIESVKNSPKGIRKIDKISLFGRSNSTETNSSDDSEKRRRKIRISVKRVLLSPLGKSFEDKKTIEPIELLSSSNDENSNEDPKLIEEKPSTNPLKGKLVGTCATPPIIILESDTSNAASVGSSVIEITSSSKIPIEKPDSSPIARRGRSCKLLEEEVLLKTASSQEINFKATTTVPQYNEVSLRNRSSSRKSAPHLPMETIAASSQSTNNFKDDDAQSIENVVSPNEDDMVRVGDEEVCQNISQKDSTISVNANQKEIEDIFQKTSEFANEKISPQVRSLRSAQYVQAKSPTPPSALSKKQRKRNKAQAGSIEIHTELDFETEVKEVSTPTVLNDDQLKLSLTDERQSPLSDGLINSYAPQSQTDVIQSLRIHKDIFDETSKKSLTESDKEEQLTSSKQTRSRSMKKLEKTDGLNLTKDSTSLPEEALKTEDTTKQLAEEDSKSERESNISSIDRSSTDTTTSSDHRRESLRLRSSTAPTKQKQTSKKISKVISNSSTPDSSSESSECHDKSPKNRKQIQSANVMMIDDKSKDETSSLCSQSSSNGSSTSSSSSSSSLTASRSTNSSSSSASSSSSSTSSSSSSSSSSTEGRSTRSARKIQRVSPEQQPQVKTAIANRSSESPSNIIKKQSNKSDSECSESFFKTDSIKEKWSSEPKRDTDQSESSDGIQKKSKTRSGRSRGRSEKVQEEEIIKKLPKKLLHEDPVSTEVQNDKITIEETLTSNTTDPTHKSPTNQEHKTDAIQLENSIGPRAKSKKRTRRFVPIKYSSSESGTLSDDGNPLGKNSSFRLTRTRRKTISSTSEIDEIPAISLSPPNLALEYTPRKPKQAEIMTQGEEVLNTNKSEEGGPPEKDLKNENNMSKTEKEPSLESKSKLLRSRMKGIRNASKCSGASDVKNDDCTDISKESESDQSSKETRSKQLPEIQNSEPPSPSPSSLSSGSSEVEGPVTVLRQRKVTRLSLKTQISDPGNNESDKNKDIESSPDKNECSQKSCIEKFPDDKKTELECDLKADKDNKSKILVEKEVHCVSGENCLENEDLLSTPSTDILDSEVVSHSKLSPKQRKGTKLFAKSPVNLQSKQENKEQNFEQKEEEIDKPIDEVHQAEISTLNCQVNKDSQISSTIYDLEKSISFKKVTRSSNNVNSTEIERHDLFHDNLAEKNKDDDNVLQEVIQIKENKEDDTSKLRKGTRLSLKKIETTNSEKSENHEKKTDTDSITLDISKSEEALKTPKQRKPTRFSPKYLEQLKHEEGQQTKEDSKNNDKSDEQKGSSPRSRKSTRLSPKNLNLQDIEVQQEDNPPGEFKADSFTETFTENSYTNTEEVIDGPLKSILVEEPSNSLSDALKLAETPKRKRKPTRFSPKSPDKQTIIEVDSSDAVLKPLADEKIEVALIDRIDEVKKTNEPDGISTSCSAVLQTEAVVKSPRVRKGTRFSPKNPDNLQFQQDSLKTKELQLPIDIENKVENQSVSEIPNVSSSSVETTQIRVSGVKTTRARKGNRLLGTSPENLQIEEELKKMLDDSKPDVSICSSFETKQLQETVKSSRAKKGTRLIMQAAGLDSPLFEGKNKDELRIKKVPGEFGDVDSKNTQQKRRSAENESTGNVENSNLSTESGEQTHSITKNISEEQITQSQSLEEISEECSNTKEAASDISSLQNEKQTFPPEDTIKCLEQTNLVIETKSVPESADPNVSITSSPSPPATFSPEITSKKGLKKQLQSMLDSLTSVDKVTITQKETTPRRKKKSLDQEQEPITLAEESPTSNKIDDIDMKALSSESNLLDDSIKQQDRTNKIDQKHTPRRQLDSSFIDSLEKSLLRPVATKKSSKKKEKDKETVVEVSSLTKPHKEESLKKSNTKKSLQEPPNEELKNSEASSPKLKKKQPKESPKTAKKYSEEQTASKRKSLAAAAAKAKEQEEIKTLLPDLSLSDVVLKDDTMTKQFSEVLPSAVVVTQTPKTKAETKFFSSPEKPLFQNEQPPVSPLIAIIPEPVAPVVIVKEKSPDLLPDPLKDIEKFIEDGVNLLKRCYKIDADDDTSLDRDILKPEEMLTPKKCKLDESVVSVEVRSEDTPQDDDNSNSNSESSTMTTNTSKSGEIDTPNGIRRSHRIKNNSKSTKCLVGRGLVRERERFSTKDDEKTIYSIDDQKMDLAEVEAKNSQFLKDMEERLSNFRVIRENEYKCERVISKEAKRMLCDCFLTHEEEERGELGCGEDCLNRLLMIECGGDCTVRERCTNRRFNKFLYSPCRVFRTEKKGFGIMADIEILPGEFIMEYVGEVINGDEFEFRINEYSKDKNKHYYFMALRSDAVIDATAKGNISRFINHSCDPNAETQKWTVNGELRIGFFSRKSIMPGEEITFDYQYQRYGKEAQRCYCESSNCRGWIGAEPSSEEEEYEGVDEEDESEESEEEERSEAVAPVVVPVIPSPTPPIIIDVANVEEQPLVSAVVAATEVPSNDSKIVPPSFNTVPQPVASPIPLAEPTVPKEITKKQLLLKKKKEKKRLLEEKLKRREPKLFLEDPDIEDEVRFLVKCGLRNQADTLRLSRLIVRAKLLETRINLLQILRQGELPCRRLFLDYHGLRLLHGWMSEVLDTRDTEKSMEIRMELLSVLECLPISNKTMLTDSKVYQTVRDWSNNKESHSPSDESPKEANANTSSASASPTSSATQTDASSELQKLAAKLVHTWDNLPEIFRIPKRERIEQMKEHEREADRQYKDLERGDMMSGSNQHRNKERFISKSGQKGRFNWSKEKERERANEKRKYIQNNSNGKDGSDKSTGSLAGESHLSKEQRRELFAAKVARDEAEKRLAEERREFDIKCRFFGLDPKRMRPENMPFCVDPSTGQWYSTGKKAISTPPSYAHVQVPVKPKSTNPEDYRLPEMDLPPLWKFAISPKGKIYYYHVKIRIPQWEPPIKILPLAGQHVTEVKNSESDSSTAGINDSSEDDIEVIKGLDPIKLQTYIEKKIEDRRLQRYNRLVEEKPISPRKEEDRIYNQIEVRKYKENKEKIRKRKEEIRKRRDIIGKQQTTLDSSNLSEITEASESVAEALPIQDYLLSSEEEDIIKAECNNSPLIDKIVQGDKIVDELDALHRKRSLKRSLPNRDKYEHKKRKLDKNKDSSKSTKRNKDGEGSSSSSKYRKVREKFRCEIAGIIVQHLKPYRNESCSNGKILTDDDFNHLARKLTHFVMVKELKYCESIGQTLIVTESVKNKSREFIKKYMAKYGKVYVRPKNDPEFKDIPFL